MSIPQSLRTLFLFLLTLGSFAFAQAQTPQQNEDDFKIYAGIDLSYTLASYADINGVDLITLQPITLNMKDFLAGELPGMGIYVGARGGTFAVELGYSATLATEKKGIALDGRTPTSSSTSLTSITADALVFLPLNNTKTFELIGSLGIANTTGDVKLTGVGTGVEKISEVKARLGIGLQAQLSPQVNIRSMVRWQDASFKDNNIPGSIAIANNLYIISIGANYTF